MENREELPKKTVFEMMLIMLFVSMLTFNTKQVMASALPGTEWTKTYGTTGNDVVRSLVQTSDGGYALAGYTNYYGSSVDAWLVKTDSAGNMLWSNHYGGADYDVANSVVQTNDGGYALAGYTSSYGAGAEDFWLVKTDGAGNIQWSKTYGGAISENAYSMVRTSDGGYALAGSTSSYGTGNLDIWLVKTDSSGTMLWNKTYGGTGNDYANSVVQTIDGGYALACGYDGSLVKTDANGNQQWNKTYSVRIGLVVQTSDAGYALAGGVNFVKTDANGNQEWSKTYSGNIASVVQTSDDGYALAGYTTIGNADMWLVKTNSAGNAQWNATYGGTDFEAAISVVQTSDAGYALAGITNSYGAGQNDFWLVKIASGGDDISPTTVNDYDGLWHTTDFTITLTASDDPTGTGVKETYYRINDGSTQNLTSHGQPRITTEGTNNRLEYWSTDKAGNEELPHKIVDGIKLDKTAPTANAGANQTANVGANVTFDASGSTDNVGIVSYEWSYGDGTKGTGKTATHNYANPGTYTVTLTVKDAANNSATDTSTVAVHSSPTAAFPTWIIVVAIALTVTAAAILLWRRKRRK